MRERERESYPLQLVFPSPLPVATSGFWNAILFLAVSRGMVTTAMIRPSGEVGRGRDGWERERWREEVVVRVSDVETVKKRWSVKTMIDCLPRTWHHRCWEHIAKLTGNAHSSEHLTELIVRSDLSIPYSSSETSISQTDWKVSYSAAVTLMCVLCMIWVESF